MPVTTRSNLIIPEVLADAVAGAWPDRIALFGTGAAVESATLPEEVRGGDTIKVPLFGSIGEFEDVAESAPLTPASLAMTSESSVVQRSGKAVEMTSWAQMAAIYADPYAEAGRQIVEGARRKFDSALVAKAGATGAGQIEVDRSTATITYDAIIDALQAWGDESQNVAAFVVHSKLRHSELVNPWSVGFSKLTHRLVESAQNPPESPHLERFPPLHHTACSASRPVQQKPLHRVFVETVLTRTQLSRPSATVS